MARPAAPRHLSVVVLGGGTVGAQVVRLLDEQADDLAARVGARLVVTGVGVRDVAPRAPGHPPGAAHRRPRGAAGHRARHRRRAASAGIEPGARADPARPQGRRLGGHRQQGAHRHRPVPRCTPPPRRPASTCSTRPPSPGRSRCCARCASRWPVTGSAGSWASSTAPPTSSSRRWTPPAPRSPTRWPRPSALGYAEADPTADVAGLDAAAKAAILASIAFHTRVTLDRRARRGDHRRHRRPTSPPPASSGSTSSCSRSPSCVESARARACACGCTPRWCRAPTRWPGCATPSTPSSSRPTPPVRSCSTAEVPAARPTASAVLGRRGRRRAQPGHRARPAPGESSYADLPVLPIGAATTAVLPAPAGARPARRPGGGRRCVRRARREHPSLTQRGGGEQAELLRADPSRGSRPIWRRTVAQLRELAGRRGGPGRDAGDRRRPMTARRPRPARRGGPALARRDHRVPRPDAAARRGAASSPCVRAARRWWSPTGSRS